MTYFASITVWDKADNRHTISTNRRRDGAYRIDVDGEFYATVDSIAEGKAEVYDLLETNGWTILNPNW
jgi:hypothetical protein